MAVLDHQVGSCITSAGKAACPTGCSNESRRRQELFCFSGEHTFPYPSCCSPGFQHRQPQEVLWLNKSCKTAACADSQPAALVMGMDMGKVMDGGMAIGIDSDPGSRPAGNHRAVTAETVSKLCDEGRLSQAVEALGVLVRTDCRIPRSLLYTVLKKCVLKKNLVLGRRIHAYMVNRGYQSDTFLGFHILRMYSSHGRLQDAMDVFGMVAKPDAFTWSAIISAHVEHGQENKAIQLYHEMRRSGVKPDDHVFVAVLQACGRGSDLNTGQQVHADVLATGVKPGLFVCTGLVNMYAKCGSLEDARRVFDGLGEKDVVMWNALIAGYSQQGKGQEALRLYNAMREEGIAVPSCVTLACLLQACASLGASALEEGKQLHAQVREGGHEGNVFVASSLVNMYAKCGSLEDAQTVFDRLSKKEAVTWTALIAGYSQQGMGQEALRLYSAMQEEGIAVPDSVTFVCLLQACASVGNPALEQGKQLHAQIREVGYQADVFVGSSLVNMYAKCGSLEDAQRVFDGLGSKSVVVWNAMIAGYSQQGMVQEAFRLFCVMQEEGMGLPNSVTFVCLLQACANVAALQLGRHLHTQIVEQGLQADVFVAGSLINMYGKAGSMVDAQQVFDSLHERDIVVWNALIAGYTCQGDSDSVFDLVHRMGEDGMQPSSVTILSVLTVCSHVGLVNKGRECFEAMGRQYGIRPSEEHYACMVDLLARAGHLDEALALVKSMPVLPKSGVWHTLLGACQKWSNVEVGRHAFAEAVKLDTKDAAAYVLMSNIYTGAQMWKQALEMQASRVGIRAWKEQGQSWWTDEDGLVHTFFVGDKKHPF